MAHSCQKNRTPVSKTSNHLSVLLVLLICMGLSPLAGAGHLSIFCFKLVLSELDVKRVVPSLAGSLLYSRHYSCEYAGVNAKQIEGTWSR